MSKKEKIRIENTINKALNEDYEELKNYFISKHLYSEEIDKNVKEYFKKSHKAIYLLGLWSHHFNFETTYRKIFLEEIRSDAIQSLQLSLLNLKRPVSLLIRSIIENLLKHIFYYDHIIEFERSEKEEQYYQSMDNLWSYLKNHPRLDLYENTDVIGRLQTEYSILSRYVHSKSSKHMSLTTSLEDLSFNDEYFKKYCTQINNISIYVNFILINFYNLYLDTFEPPWKYLILNILSKELRSKI